MHRLSTRPHFRFEALAAELASARHGIPPRRGIIGSLLEIGSQVLKVTELDHGVARGRR
jgi:hypothetical protein